MKYHFAVMLKFINYFFIDVNNSDVVSVNWGKNFKLSLSCVLAYYVS